MKITPSLTTAALAGLFSAVAMPMLWARFANDSAWLTIAFLLVVALPAHAFVVGFGHRPEPGAARLDTALLKRVAAWLGATLVALGITWALRA